LKVFAIISVARQVDGEYCVVKVEKAFKTRESAEQFSKELSTRYAESIVTPNGTIACVCERGVFEIDLTD